MDAGQRVELTVHCKVPGFGDWLGSGAIPWRRQEERPDLGAVAVHADRLHGVGVQKKGQKAVTV